jgi:hypothetical protein
MEYERFLFFQGSIDMGGACLFAGWIMLYVVFGFTAGWYLVLKLSQIPYQSFSQSLIKYLWILTYHIAAFLCGGIMLFPGDGDTASNDFRNMFLFVCVLYGFSIAFICLLHKSQMKMRLKLFLSPLFISIWLFIGSDSNTKRAGQFVSPEKNHVYQIRGKRHQVMVAWHKFCDSLLGEVEPRGVYQRKRTIDQKEEVLRTSGPGLG